VPFLHGIRDTIVRDKARQGCTKNPERTEIREETVGETGRHQWGKEPRLKGAAMSEEGQDIWQNLWENHKAGDREVNRWVFCQDLKNECQNIVEPVHSEREKETAHRVRATAVGALAILGTSACTDQRKMVINLN
jgi:hypothetical protein